MKLLHCAVLLVNLLAGGCLGDTAEQVPGQHFHYIVSDMQLHKQQQSGSPIVAIQGLDLDGDNNGDNQLGAVFNLLRSNGFEIQPTLTAAIQNGDILLGLDVQTPNMQNADSVNVQVRTGFAASPTPCSGDAPIMCGQHLHGDATIVVDAPTPSLYSTGALSKSVLLTRGGILPVRLALEKNNYIELNLHEAAVSITFEDTNPTGTLAGVVLAADIERVLVPQIGLQFRRIVDEDCGTKVPGRHRRLQYCQCRAQSRGFYLLALFDQNEDCLVSDQEIMANSLTRSLLSPDIEGPDGDGFSFAIAIKLAPATFALVAP